MTVRENVQVAETSVDHMTDPAKRVQELEALVEFARAVNSSLHLNRVLEMALEVSVRVTGADAAIIRVLDEFGMLRVACQKGYYLTETDRAWAVKLGEGVAGRAALQKQVIAIEDVRNFGDVVLSPHKMNDLSSILAVPVCHQDRLIGTLSILARRGRSWQLPEQYFLESLGSQMGLAISNAKLYELSVVQAQRLGFLHEFSQNVSVFMDVQELLSEAAKTATSLLQVQAAGLFFMEGENPATVAIGSGSEDLFAEERIGIEKSLSGLVLKHRQPFPVRDLAGNHQVPISSKSRLLSLGYTSFLGVPIELQNRVLGVLNVYSKVPCDFDVEGQAALCSLADLVATSFDRIRMFRNLEVSRRNLEQHNQELEQLNSQLLESRRIFDIFFRSNETALVFANAAKTIIKVSPLLEEFLGLDPDSLVGKPIEFFIDSLLPRMGLEGSSLQELREMLVEVGQGGEFDFPTGIRGDVFLSLICDPLMDEAGGSFGKIFVFRDITERVESKKKLKETHALLLQSEKLASIGQLAAGVAHELNNPIAFVKSNLGTLREYVDDLTVIMGKCQEAMVCWEGGKREKCCHFIEEAFHLSRQVDLENILSDLSKIVEESVEGAERVAKIVLDLKNFARADEAERKYADINHGIESTLNIVWNELKYKATVIKELGELPEIECYPMQLNQVFMNLLMNAAQAIAEKGEIRIKTFVRNDEVIVEISDTGAGILPEHLNRIFDPFFTTKPVGKGTGLGLNIAYGIVKKHGGAIEVESEPGKGSLFRVRLPVGDEYPSEPPIPGQHAAHTDEERDSGK